MNENRYELMSYLEYPIPTSQDDIHAVRETLIRLFPAKIANLILSQADYWIVTSEKRKIQTSVRASSTPRADASICYLVCPPLPPGAQVQRVQFVTKSRDQGWTTDGPHFSTVPKWEKLIAKWAKSTSQSRIRQVDQGVSSIEDSEHESDWSDEGQDDQPAPMTLGDMHNVDGELVIDA
ncbi:hypothetical protein B0H13DRAFT_2301447 [Mycena leptocephala]|nr:hypothetical protein B0H13DRAFT_2301447 [Mycena leptocephala]